MLGSMGGIQVAGGLRRVSGWTPQGCDWGGALLPLCHPRKPQGWCYCILRPGLCLEGRGLLPGGALGASQELTCTSKPSTKRSESLFYMERPQVLPE